MKDIEIVNIWKSYDQKLDEVLSLNKEIVYDLTKEKARNTIGTMRKPKRAMLIIGIPYTIFHCFITFIGYKAGAIFVTLGFGSISLIISAIIIGYFYHLHLINSINRLQEVVDVQKKIAELKISSFNIARLALVQIPFWSICWMSLDALKKSPMLYGGINLIVFLALAYFSYWLYKRLNLQNSDSKISRLFLSGAEWEPIINASEILDQLKDYKK
jgi:hypothetical protein